MIYREKSLKFHFKNQLPKEILEEIVLTFENAVMPLNYPDISKKYLNPKSGNLSLFGVYPIKGAGRYDQAHELIIYNPQQKYLDFKKGGNTSNLIRKVLEKHDIKYTSALSS